MTASTESGQMPDYWRTPEEGEPMARFAVETAASYLRNAASLDLDRAATRLRLAAALDPAGIGGQDPHPRFGADQNDTDQEVLHD